MTRQKILIACEFSGIVRDAFIARGHDAISCDLLPSERPGPHYWGDVRDILDERWDMMIAHPPCQYLTTCANRVWNAPGRAKLREEAFNFFMLLYDADIPKVCIENPQGYVNSNFRQPDQTIHPYYFGGKELKRTCLWLRGLPPLIYEKDKYKKPDPKYLCKGKKSFGKRIYFSEGARGCGGSNEDRRKYRSRTFPEIAEAMAEQWG